MTQINLAVIPARSGSKGIPNKNIRNFHRKPLIYWSIKRAISLSFIDRVIVSTDSMEISNIAKSFGAEAPFLRPSAISGDDSTTEDAVLHCIEWLEKNSNYKPDNILLLQPTSPIRWSQSVYEMYQQFIDYELDSIFSVTESGQFLWKNFDCPQSLHNILERPMRQNIKLNDKYFYENGSIYIFKRRSFIKSHNRISGKHRFFALNKYENIDIDDIDDWEIGEQVISYLLNTNRDLSYENN